MSVSKLGVLGESIKVRRLGRVQVDWLGHGAVALIVSGLVFAYIQFANPTIVGTDGFYHIKMAELIRQQGLPVHFPWLKFTILDEAGYTDHHLLLHLFQVPFTYLGSDLRVAAKLSPVILAALTFAVFYLLLWRYGIRYPLLWLILLFASSGPFLFRMSMARGQSLSLALQLLAFHLIMRRQAVGLAILSAVFVWAYNAFPILIPLVIFGALTHYVVDKTIEYKLVVGVGVGIAAGLIINPYFPRDLVFLWNHLVPKLFAAEYATSVGREWYPYNSWAFFTLSLVAIIAYLGALLITNRDEWLDDKPRLFWFLVSTMYLVLLLKSRRFVEYFPPTAVVFFAFSVRGWLNRLDLTRALRTEARVAGLVVASLLLLLAFRSSVQAARQDIADLPPYEAYKGGAEWLARHTPEGSTVFHTDWDDFPKLFYFNTHNTYLVGLDPDFMRLKDEKLFRRWEAITRGKVAHPEDAILHEFGCQYVFTDNKHREFMAIADGSPRMEKVYSDRYATVYRVLETAPSMAPTQ